MCFRPAETELGPLNCPSCSKRINRTAGQLPSKCPFCKEPTEGIEDMTAAPPALSKPEAPQASGAPAPKAPSKPTAPFAPPASKAPPAAE